MQYWSADEVSISSGYVARLLGSREALCCYRVNAEAVNCRSSHVVICKLISDSRLLAVTNSHRLYCMYEETETQKLSFYWLLPICVRHSHAKGRTHWWCLRIRAEEKIVTYVGWSDGGWRKLHKHEFYNVHYPQMLLGWWSKGGLSGLGV